MAKKMDSKTCQNAIFAVLKSSSFPPKRVNNVASTRKSRQQTGLKAYIYMYIYIISLDESERRSCLRRSPRWCCKPWEEAPQASFFRKQQQLQLLLVGLLANNRCLKPCVLGGP